MPAKPAPVPPPPAFVPPAPRPAVEAAEVGEEVFPHLQDLIWTVCPPEVDADGYHTCLSVGDVGRAFEDCDVFLTFAFDSDAHALQALRTFKSTNWLGMAFAAYYWVRDTEVTAAVRTKRRRSVRRLGFKIGTGKCDIE